MAYASLFSWPSLAGYERYREPSGATPQSSPQIESASQVAFAASIAHSAVRCCRPIRRGEGVS